MLPIARRCWRGSLVDRRFVYFGLHCHPMSWHICPKISGPWVSTSHLSFHMCAHIIFHRYVCVRGFHSHLALRNEPILQINTLCLRASVASLAPSSTQVLALVPAKYAAILFCLFVHFWPTCLPITWRSSMIVFPVQLPWRIIVPSLPSTMYGISWLALSTRNNL